MLLNTLANRLRGQVRLETECAYPERVLNLCGARKLAFWDLKWESATAFSCTMTRRDFRTLRRASEKLGCTLRVEKTAGAPFLLRRFSRRRVLAAGLTVCAAALFFGSFFIWDFQIEGNETVPDEKILRALEQNGVTFGTFGFSIDGEELRNHVLLDVPELSWIAVNVSGCQAHVQVRQRIPAPSLADRRTPANIVARRDGLVLKVNALGGEKAVLPGDTVEQGQLLISGIRDTDTFGARMMAGMGTVTARTWYALTARVPLTAEQKVYTGEERTRLYLIFGTHRIKIYGGATTSDGNYDKIAKRTHIRLLGVPLPVTAEQETLRQYGTQTVQTDAAAAEKRVGAVLNAYLRTLVGTDGAVSSTLCTSKRSGDTLAVTLRAECVEQIGVSVPIYTDTNESGEKP